jgi:acyl-CoA thioesterase-2
MWFHSRCAFLNDWLLYTQDSPSSSGDAWLSRGALYTVRAGALIASVAQEGLIRLCNGRLIKI